MNDTIGRRRSWSRMSRARARRRSGGSTRRRRGPPTAGSRPRP